MKDKDDVKYYPQILLDQCVYRLFSNNTIIYSDLEYTDTELDSEEELMKILYLMNKNNSLIINKILIVCINYALLGFYFRHFERCEGVKRLDCV